MYFCLHHILENKSPRIMLSGQNAGGRKENKSQIKGLLSLTF